MHTHGHDSSPHDSPAPPMLPAEERSRVANRVTLGGLVVNLVLLVLKFLAGFVAGSQAMIADAVHTLSDFVTDIMVFVGIALGKKPADQDHPYGHGKYETIAAVGIGLLLGYVGIKIGWDGLERIIQVIQTGTLPPRPGMFALIAALVSIVAKEILYRVTIAVGRRISSTAVIANAWHHRTDALSSIGTAVGIGGAVIAGAEWTILDPLAALVVSVFILKAAIMIIRSGFGDLVDTALDKAAEQEIVDVALSVPGIRDPHRLRTRKVGTILVVDIHVRMDGELPLKDAHAICTRFEERLRERFGQQTISTVHMEPISHP